MSTPSVRPPLPVILLGIAAAVVLVAQPVLAEADPSIVVLGVVDESAHLSTALLVLANVRWPGGWTFAAAALAASVLIDLDHLPNTLFGSEFLTEGTPRPYPHSLTTPLAALALAGASAGRVRTAALGVALGVLTHLFRDLATGPGVALAWPLSRATADIPFALYAAAVLLLLARAWAQARTRP